MTEQFKDGINNEITDENQISTSSPSPSREMKPMNTLQDRRRTSTKSFLAAFMAGAVMVGSLMLVSDKLNLFSGGPGTVSAASSTTTTNSGSVQTASLSTSGTGSISAIAKQSSPAVVKIETKTTVSTKQQNNPLYNNPLFQQFMGGNGGGGQAPQQNGNGNLQPSGLGSGFIFDSSGYILTNEHVINGADEIDVYVQGYDKPFTAKLLGSSYDLDLAVLQIVGDKAFPALKIGNSDTSQVGDWLVAIGNPYDYDYTVTAGVLSAKDRPISIDDQQGTRNYQHLLQTDTAINPGNSGGPLLNLNGEVIGINTAISADAQGIGFAIPTSTISSVLDKLKNNQTIPKAPSPYLGVSVQDITPDMLNDLKLSSTNGAVVAAVQQKSPAFQAGIRQYDVIVAVNGTRIANSAELTKKIQTAKVGDQLQLTISRNGQTQEITVTVGDKNSVSNSQN